MPILAKRLTKPVHPVLQCSNIQLQVIAALFLLAVICANNAFGQSAPPSFRYSVFKGNLVLEALAGADCKATTTAKGSGTEASSTPKDSREVELFLRDNVGGTTTTLVAYLNGPKSPTGELIGLPKQLNLEYALPDEKHRKGHKAQIELQSNRLRLTINERPLASTEAGCNAILAQFEGQLDETGETARIRWQAVRDDFQFQQEVFSAQNKDTATFSQIVQLREKAQQSKESNPAQAVLFLRESQALIVKLFGERSAIALVNLWDLADAHEDAAQTADAIAQFKLGLALAQAMHPEPHVRVARRAARFGRALMLDEQYAEALPVLQLAVMVAHKTFPTDSKEMPALLSNLSNVSFELNDRTQGLELARKAQVWAQRVFGENSAENSEFITRLVDQLRAVFQYKEAYTLAQRSLQIALSAHGENHLVTSQRLDLMAKVLKDIGNPLEALTFYQRSLASIKASDTPDPDREATAFNNLAYALHELERNDEAIKSFQQGIALAKAKLNADAPHVASLEIGLANALLGKGQSNEALDLAMQITGRARERYQKALGRSAIAISETRSLVSALGLLGSIHRYRGEYKQGQSVFNQALELARKSYASDASALAVLLSDASRVALSMAQYTRARQLLDESIRINIARFGPDHPIMINSRFNLAQLLYTVGSQEGGTFDAALSEMRTAYAISVKTYGTGSLDTATIRAEEGLILMLAQRPAEALTQLVLADEVFTKVHGKFHRKTIGNLTNIARARADLGEFSEALELFKRSVSDTAQLLGADHVTTGAAINNLGVHYRNLGLYPEALASLRESLRISELADGPEHPSTATSLSNVAIILLSTEQLQEARALFEKSLAITEKLEGPNHPRTAVSLNNLSTSLSSLNQYAEAAKLARRALKISEQQIGSESPSAVIARSNLANYLRNIDDDAQQRTANVGESLALSEAGLVSAALNNQLLSKVTAYRSAAWALNEIKHPKAAIFLAKIALNTLQSLRNQSRSLDAFAQRGLAQENLGVYQDLADWLIAEGRFTEAEQALAMLKDQELFELVRLDGSGATTIELNPNEALVFANLQAREAEGRALSLKSSTQALERWRDEFLTTLRQLEVNLSRPNESMTIWKPKETPQSTFAKGSVLLKYVVSNQRISVLIQTQKGIEAVQIAMDRKELVRQIDSLRIALTNPRIDPRPFAHSLHRVLIEPLKAQLEAQQAQTLSLDLTDVLRYLPFGSLHDGKQYLIEKYTVMLATPAGSQPASTSNRIVASAPTSQSQTSGVQLPGTTQPSRWQIAALGLTQAQQGFSALPAVKDELESIVRTPNNRNGLLPGTLELDAQFGRTQLVGALQSGKPVVHVASHFQFTPGTEHGTFLLLGDGQKLSLAEMKKMPFTGLQLFVLSACNTGSGGGRNELGAEVEGLGVTIQRAGAKAVLASLWEVSDRSTALLMRQFYSIADKASVSGTEASAQRAHSAITTASSLRNAQLALLRGSLVDGVSPNAINQSSAEADLTLRAATRRDTRTVNAPVFVSDPLKPFAHPFYWAAFIVMGNAN